VPVRANGHRNSESVGGGGGGAGQWRVGRKTRPPGGGKRRWGGRQRFRRSPKDSLMDPLPIESTKHSKGKGGGTRRNGREKTLSKRHRPAVGGPVKGPCTERVTYILHRGGTNGLDCRDRACLRRTPYNEKNRNVRYGWGKNSWSSPHVYGLGGSNQENCHTLWTWPFRKGIQQNWRRKIAKEIRGAFRKVRRLHRSLCTALGWEGGNHLRKSEKDFRRRDQRVASPFRGKRATLDM